MVEIPEHLLKRSKERRAALGLGGGEDAPSAGAGESAAPPEQAAATPAPTPPKAAPPAPKEPEPPKPDPVYIQAAKQRQRLPYWALPVFAALPLWGYFFVRTLSPATADVDPVAEGQAMYTSSCAGCHGATGGGSGTFPALTEVGETWPDFRDQMMWVRVGAQDWPGDTYGANDLTNTHTMPAFAELTDQELAQVVLYERQDLAGIEPTDEEIGTTADGEPLTEESLLQIAEGELTFAEVGLGTEAEEAGIPEETLEGP